MFCCEDFFVNGFRFKINNGRWSDTSAIRIPETNLSGGSVNILSISKLQYSVIREGLVIIGMREKSEGARMKFSTCKRIKQGLYKVDYVFFGS